MTRLAGRALAVCLLAAGLVGPVAGRSAVAVESVPHPAVTSDFDGDGRIDVAAATGTSRGVRVRYTSARPGGSHVAWLTPHLPPHDGQVNFGEAMAVGDFNGDGYADLAVSAPLYAPKPPPGRPGTACGAILVFHGSRQGLDPVPERIFGPKGEQPASFFGYGLVAGDVSGDGYADLAVTHLSPNADSSDVRLYLGSADGPPTKASRVLPEDAPQALAVGDVNGDGRPDLVAASGPPLGGTGVGHLTVWPGTAASVGTPYQIELADLGLRYIADLALDAGDLDGDGYADVAIGDEVDQRADGSYTGTLVVVKGSADGLTAAGHQDVDGDHLTGQTNTAFASAISLDPAHEGVPGRVYVGDVFEDVHGLDKAGAVHVFHWDGAGLSTTDVPRITQASPGVPGRPVKHGSFGLEVWAVRTPSQRYARLFVGAAGPAHHGQTAGAYFAFRGNAAGVSTRSAVRVSGHKLPSRLGVIIR
jgi:hypothetical protein